VIIEERIMSGIDSIKMRLRREKNHYLTQETSMNKQFVVEYRYPDYYDLTQSIYPTREAAEEAIEVLKEEGFVDIEIIEVVG
jgi:hypothetical protein